MEEEDQCNIDDMRVGFDQRETIQLDALPDEILEFILTYLPPYKDLENCRLVCKRWSGVVKNLIRRTKINLHKGLLDYHLRWEVFSQQTAESAARLKTENVNNSSGLPIISGRFSHSTVRHENSMYIFGGGSCSDTTFNDLWRFDLSEMRWELPLSMGSYPTPKGSASMVCWREQLILFGGWRYPSLHPPYQPWCLFEELHYYDLVSNRWTVHNNLPCPPPMAGHSATVHGDSMIVFGGYQISDGFNSNSNDIWCLDLHEKKWWQPRLLDETKPPPRYGQVQLVLDDEHLLIVGGCGGPNAVYSDAWVLDMSHDIWHWRSVPVRNKKFGAPHMWCNPACKIDSKLVVLGPTPNMPQDFQMMRQTRVHVGGVLVPRVGAMQYNRNNPLENAGLVNGGGGVNNGGIGGADVLRAPHNHNRLDNFRVNDLHGPDEHFLANRRAILNQHHQNANNVFFNNNSNCNNNNNNNNLQPRTGRVRDLHSPTSSGPSTSASSSTNTTSASSSSSSSSNSNDTETANRLQRNLALGCRDNEPLLPKRFDELYEDPFRMAAFNVQTRSRSLSKDHHERIRRMEEKMNAIRNSRRIAMIEQKTIKEPSPKRVKRNVLSLFVCDLSAALRPSNPYLEWIEYKNYGIIPGAPERLILSTMVAGHGELILFGGVHKETLAEISHHVSNSVHFLSAPREIV